MMHSLGGGPATNILAVVVHTAWLNLDLIWAVALMVTGSFVLLI